MNRLSIACVVDADIVGQLRRADASGTRARYDLSVLEALQRHHRRVEIVTAGKQRWRTVEALHRLRPDVIFNLAFSAQPEEASFAACLDALGIPYTGSGPRGIVLTNDKIRSRMLLRAAGIEVPRFVALAPDAVIEPDTIAAAGRPPFIVKPATMASSAGIYADSVLRSRRGVGRLVRRIWSRFGVPALCEEFIVGRELRVGLVEVGGRLTMTGISEWRFGRAEAGWGFKTEAIRANLRVRRARAVTRSLVALPRRLTRTVAATARQALQVLDVRGYATVDLRLDAAGRLVLLEANSNPGLWSGSAIWSRPSFDTNIRRIVQSALTRELL